jgi:hypothetical protein
MKQSETNETQVKVMDLLTNAIESVQVGVQDYQEGGHGRLLSAVRNIHAGIFLLYKEALRRASPADSNEALLKARVVARRNEDGKVTFVGEGDQAADAEQVRERLEQLGLASDWPLFQRLTDVCAGLEHAYNVANKSALASFIADAFNVARTFLSGPLGEDALTLLGDKTWRAMSRITKIHEEEREACCELLGSVEWGSETLATGVLLIDCPACGGNIFHLTQASRIFDDNLSLHCRACGEILDSHDYVPVAVAAALALEMLMVGEGGEAAPYVKCPVCGREAYVVGENKCALCGHVASFQCALCGGKIEPQDLDCSPFCGTCERLTEEEE